MNEQDLTTWQDTMTAKIRALWHGFEAIAIARSDFQLEHFVVKEHLTPERQWWQAMLELQGCLFELERAAIDIERRQRKIAEVLREQKGEWDLDLRAEHLAVEESKLWRLRKLREADTLYALQDKLVARIGHQPTEEELQLAEARYWMLRFERNVQTELRATGTVQLGTLQAIHLLRNGELGERHERQLTDTALEAAIMLPASKREETHGDPTCRLEA